MLETLKNQLDNIPEETDTIPDPMDVVDWAEDNFYIIEGKRKIVLHDIQKIVLREFFRRGEDGRFIYRTGLYSTIKKSGKTTVAALVMQWAAEQWGDYGEIFHLGNKREQAQKRAFKIAKRSIEMSHNKNDWEIASLSLTHLPTKSVIQALPVNAAGESGGNQRLTTWTEAHGYVYEENERMWTELQPIPTQFFSFRFLESYAGYEGESNLLKTIWDRALERGHRIHPDFPIYAVPEEGLIAYIDDGIAARRMPWQTPDYYIKAEAEEMPHEYLRIHHNKWVTSQNPLVDIGLWDRLATDDRPALPGRTDVVISVDASVSGDCTSLAIVSYDPVNDIVTELETYVWEPPADGKIDYDETVKPIMDYAFSTYRVIGVAYDEYQMHNFMTEYKKTTRFRHRKDFFYAFPQTSERLKSDTDLLRRIRQENLQHSGDETLRQHIKNADSKASGDKAIRIVKRHTKLKIDAVIALSMASWRIYQLFQSKTTHNPHRRAKVTYRD